MHIFAYFREQQGCATTRDEPGAAGDPAQAVPSLTGCSATESEHGAEPGGHSNESHQQPQTKQSNQPVPRSIQQIGATGRTGDRTTAWVHPEGKVRGRHAHSIAQARTECQALSCNRAPGQRVEADQGQ